MEIDLRDFEDRLAHDMLTSSIIPRPIAWVSSISDDGKPNIAPFSFFTGVQWHPPVLAFSVVNRADGSRKDTITNIEQTYEFVINIVSRELLAAMELSARPIPQGKDEAFLECIHLTSSKTVKPKRIVESKIAFECTLDRIVCVDSGANAGNLVLGRVQLMHVSDDLLIAGREVDWRSLDALGRLSGDRYCALDSIIISETN